MVELDNVLSNYIQTKTEHPLVPGQSVTSSLQAIRHDIPNLLKKFLGTAGYNVSDFHVHGSVGEPNRSFAKVPWVAIFKRSITKSAQRGYYIVLLFSEDMSSASISLNQGYTAFEKRYVYPKLAYEKLRDCARAASEQLPTKPVGFFTGPIDLHTNGPLARGYEAGAILSKTYLAGTTPTESELEKDVHTLLDVYMALANQFAESLIDLDVNVTPSDYNEAVANIKLDSPNVPSTTGPQPPPAKGLSKGTFKYVRSPEVASRALLMSKYECALSTANNIHVSFISAKTKQNYVEAHHVIPFSQQPAFSNSLDVEENIAALCPNCHKMLHYGTSAEKVAPLKMLFQKRNSDLQARGINVTFEQLRQMYRTLSEDD